MNKTKLSISFLFFIFLLHSYSPAVQAQIAIQTPTPNLPSGVHIEKGGILVLEQYLSKQAIYRKGEPFQTVFNCEQGKGSTYKCELLQVNWHGN